MKERIPPHSMEHEICTLGSMLLDRDAALVAVGRLNADDFYLTAHRVVFGTMAAMVAAGTPVDLVTLPTELHRVGKLAEIGGVGYLGELVESTPTAANVAFYADAVADHAARRRIILTATEAVDIAYRGRDDPDATLDKLEAKVVEALRQCRRGDAAIPLPKSLRELADRLRKPREDRPRAIPWRIPCLDRISGGVFPGELTVLASRPAVGKTAMALQLAEEANIEDGAGVLYFSLEMAEDYMASRVAARKLPGHIALRDFRDDRVTAAEADRIEPIAAMFRAPFLVDYSTRSPAGICAASAAAVSKHGIRLVVIDLLGHVEDPAGFNHDNKATRVSAVVRSFMRLALDQRCAVVLLAHLNRENDKAGRQPKLSDLKECGDIEGFARQVVLLHAPDEKTRHSVQAIVAKNSQGATGVAMMHWNGDKQTYSDPDEPPPYRAAGEGIKTKEEWF